MSKESTKKFIEKYWPLLVGAALFFFGVIGLILNYRSQIRPHEIDVLPLSQISQQVQKLPEIMSKPIVPLAAEKPTSCADNGPGKLLLISISQQHIWACDGVTIANQGAVTTGASGLSNVDNATPTGSWHLQRKVQGTTLKGCDVNGCWDDLVQYWMPYAGDIGFHDSAWQTFPYGSQQYTTEGSHGCVHLPLGMAAWVYSWAPIGTSVTIVS